VVRRALPHLEKRTTVLLADFAEHRMTVHPLLPTVTKGGCEPTADLRKRLNALF
jgi:hypothetical protein